MDSDSTVLLMMILVRAAALCSICSGGTSSCGNVKRMLHPHLARCRCQRIMITMKSEGASHETVETMVSVLWHSSHAPGVIRSGDGRLSLFDQPHFVLNSSKHRRNTGLDPVFVGEGVRPDYYLR